MSLPIGAILSLLMAAALAALITLLTPAPWWLAAILALAAVWGLFLADGISIDIAERLRRRPVTRIPRSPGGSDRTDGS